MGLLSNMDKLKKGIRYISPAAALVILLIIVKVQGLTNAAADTGAQVAVAVNYFNETATISTGPGGSTNFYISLDKGKTWEGISAGETDIAAFMSTKEVQVYFKGNKDTIPNIVTLMAEPAAPEVTYLSIGGIGRITFTSDTGMAVEYRKGTNGTWKPAVNNMSTALYEIKGTTLYFRTAATAVSRPGKIASVRISKRPNAPSVKLDGSKLILTGFKPGETEYRINDDVAWTTFPTADLKAKTISLYTLFAAGVTSNSPIPAGKIEFRTKGTDKKITSASKMIEIPLQLTIPNVVMMNGTTLTITDSTPKRMYEYAKVPAGTAYNLATAKWTSVSPNKPTVISKVNINDKVYVRVKSTTDSLTKQIIPASTYKDFVITAITPGK